MTHLEQKINAQYKDSYTQEDVDNYDAANKRLMSLR